MSNESQVETEADAPLGRPSPRAALSAGPFGVVAAVIALGVVVAAAVFFAVGSDDTERAAFESRSFEDRASSQDEIAEWRSVIDSGAIAASLDGTELTWSELEGMLERLPVGAPRYTGVPDLDTTRQVVRQWMITRALKDELAARGIESDTADRQAALDETLLADPTFDETTPYGVLALETRSLTTTLDRVVDDLALAAELERPEYLCSSHILVETEAEAEEIVALLDEGADFAALAIERSGDGSAAIGGDLVLRGGRVLQRARLEGGTLRIVGTHGVERRRPDDHTEGDHGSDNAKRASRQRRPRTRVTLRGVGFGFDLRFVTHEDGRLAARSGLSGIRSPMISAN